MSIPNRGRFIVIEGIDGCGKTTQLAQIKKELDLCAVSCIMNEEPTHNRPIGKLIREIATGNYPDVSLTTLLPLFIGDRIDHTFNEKIGYGILATINAGFWYLESRWYLSSIAYQGGDFGYEYAKACNKIFPDALHADLTIYLDIPVDVAIERMKAGRDSLDLIESNRKGMEEKYARYEQILKDPDFEKENIHRIDATQKQDVITDEIMELIYQL